MPAGALAPQEISASKVSGQVAVAWMSIGEAGVVAGFIPYAAAQSRALQPILIVDTVDGFSLPQPRPVATQPFTDELDSGDTSVWSATVP